MRKTIIWEF